ncbi:nonstructural protein [Tapara virus]|uniref:Nonstructural protein n=1 Tax=Tapara virus TaxID=1926501 RepID=A0A1S5SHW6_9VIRU|nr:nonstructural protein [Tapara virus]API68894.1 nonstructural protein [Tapara virus]
MSSYLYDRPIIFRQSQEDCSVQYLAFNSFTDREVCVNNDMEIPVENYMASCAFRESLQDFYRAGTLPLKWGDEMPVNRVTKGSYRLMDGVIESLSRFSREDIIKSYLPNVQNALSWPLGYPTLDFIKACVMDTPLYTRKSTHATLIFRTGQPADCLDQSFVNSHRRIVMESVTRGFDVKTFTGQNLVRDIASLQCVRVLNAYQADLLYCGVSTELTKELSKLRIIHDGHPQNPLGNQRWIASPDSWDYRPNPDVELDFDLDISDSSEDE